MCIRDRESIDLNAIADELKALETEMKVTDKMIAEFCNELNIDLSLIHISEPTRPY